MFENSVHKLQFLSIHEALIHKMEYKAELNKEHSNIAILFTERDNVSFKKLVQRSSRRCQIGFLLYPVIST